MRIGIVGAGMTGLAASHFLSKKGYQVSVFERASLPGGLACGFKQKNWEWSLERYYHHFFTSDLEAKELAKDLKIKIIFTRPKTSVFTQGKLYPLDSPFDVLSFDKLTLLERLRLGFSLAFLKVVPSWKVMEKVPASKFLPKMMGRKTYEILWAPLFYSKFGKDHDQIPLSWFWARIKKRSTSLGYPEGGFQRFALAIQKKGEKEGVKFYFNQEVKEIKKEKKAMIVSFNDGSQKFDRVIFTPSCRLFLEITKGLSQGYVKQLGRIKSLSILSLILVLKKPFFFDKTYWLNVCDQSFPFLSIIEQTNFIDKKYYDHCHLLYVGKYLPSSHPYFSKSKEELLEIYHPYLAKINANYQKEVTNLHLFKDNFAQPIIFLNYSKILPPFKTPIENLYLATMEQVYPWDRGVNYALELGKKVSQLVENE